MKNDTTIYNFGKQLSSIRRSKGFTQEELAEKIGVSRRVIAYYESETKYPPTHLLLPIAKAFNVSVDQLLGVKATQASNPEHDKIWRRLKRAEQLSPKDRKLLFEFLDALLAKKK